MMWKKHWAIPTFIGPMILASGACSVGVTVKYEWMPLPIVARRLVWAMVCPPSPGLANHMVYLCLFRQIGRTLTSRDRWN